MINQNIVNDFKDHWRLMCDDTFEDAKEAWMEGAAHMVNRDLCPPIEWQYAPSIRPDDTDENSAMHDHYKTMDDDTLVYTTTLMFRYTRYLDFKGLRPVEEDGAPEVWTFYNLSGYRVYLDGEEIYSAGNNAYDNQSWLPRDHPAAISLEKMKEYAERTTKELSLENKAKNTGVSFKEDEDEEE